MLGHVEGIGGVVVALDKFDETQRFGKLVHASLGAVQLDSGNARRHDVAACAAHKPVDGGAATLVKWYVLAGAVILQVGQNLRANSHGSCPNCAHNGATLFRRQYSFAARMTVQSVLSGLQQRHPVLVVLDSQGNITITREPIGTIQCISRETILGVVAGAVNLAQNRCNMRNIRS